MGIAPYRVYLVAELQGGTPTELLYCLEEQWEWPNGTKSSHQPDCEPFSGEIERRWSVWKVVGAPGDHEIKFRLLRKGKVVVETSLTILAH